MIESIKQKMINHYNEAYKVKILDYTFSSQPSINYSLPLKRSTFKLLLFIFGCILSLGLLWLITKWSQSKKSIILYYVCVLSQAQYFLIESDSNKSVIVQKINKYDFKRGELTFGFKYHERFYLYNPQKECFLPIRYQDLGFHLESLKKSSFRIYSKNIRPKLLEYYGINAIRLPIQSKFEVFVQQMMTPYEVFQAYAIILWLYEEYYLFASIVLIYSFYTYWEISWEVTENQRKLAEESFIDMQCKIVITQMEDPNIVQPLDAQNQIKTNRSSPIKNMINKSIFKDDKGDFNFVEQQADNQDEISISIKSKSKNQSNQKSFYLSNSSSLNILPGDLIILKQGDLIPCDCLLLNGQILVNQGSNDYPTIVRKSYLHDFTYISQIQNSFTLYQGGCIVKCKSDKRNLSLSELINKNAQNKINIQQNEIICLVTGTNYNTQKGKYLRQITHYKTKGNTFTKQSIYFIYILLVITVISFAILLYKISSNSASKLFHIFLDLVSTSIPPTLPTALSFGIKFAQSRLKKKNIHCVLPEHILTAGKTDCIVLQGRQVFCKDYKVNSVLIGIKKQRSIGSLYTSKSQFEASSEHPPYAHLFFYALATCHTLQLYMDQIKGNPQQLQIYNFAKSQRISQDEYIVNSRLIKIKKRIYFKAAYKKLAVITQFIDKQQGQIIQHSFSNTQLNSAKRFIFVKGPPQKIISCCKPNTYPFQCQSYIIDMAEKGFQLIAYAFKQIYSFHDDVNAQEGLIFLGFAILERVVQIETINAVQSLKNANIQVLYISDDRQIECNSIGISNHISSKKQLLSCSVNKAKDQVFCRGHTEWQSQVSENSVDQFVREIVKFKNIKLNLTAALYQQIFMRKQYFNKKQLLNLSVIFSRMQFKHQRNLFSQLQSSGKTTLVVGRANMLSDQADISLELQRGQSSLFSSFHTKQTTLVSVVNCLKICRAGLSTNFHCFNMMILLSLVQYTTVCILQYNFQTLSSQQTLYEDLFISFPIFITMNMTQPTQKLSKEKPVISFFSKRALLTMVGLTILQFIGQTTFILILQRFAIFSKESHDSFLGYSSTGQFIQGTVTCHSMFVLSNFVYLGIVLGTSVSKSFRKPFYTNIYYTLNIIILWIYNITIVLVPKLAPNSYYIQGMNQSQQFVIILAMVYGNLIMIILYLYESSLDWIWRKKSSQNQKQINESIV